MRVPVPRPVARQVAEVATQRVRESVFRRGWSSRSAESFQPVYDKGVVGIRSDLNYMMFQNRGIKPFVMWWAEGRRIPLPGGVVTARGVGQPGYVMIPSQTLPGVKVAVWRDKKWRHPGLKPKRFIENAISQAILEAGPTLQERTIRALAGEQENDDDR